ncbi:MAG: type I DNA topoisomerase [Candidatus Omnitrophota bacterium]
MTATKKSVSKKRVPSKKKSLVIVESPAKSKTINKILGDEYKVLASMGHIVDLPASKMGIDFDNDFKPEYVVMKGRKKYVMSLKKEAKGAKAIYLAADPDREGEAICWHLRNQLEEGNENIYRVSFDEITRKAVLEAFQHPRELDMNKVNAQQARRLLDRIVGYSISPLLWQKITRGLSAGRVQSVAVRLIVEREEEIRNFTTLEYWSIDAALRKKDGDWNPDGLKPADFTAKLVKHKGEKIHIADKASADRIVAEIEGCKFIVSDTSRKDKKSYPRAPYTTSVLQQDAFNKLNFSASKTMRTAQTLYEGVELGAEGSVGLITYMRTDSVRISDDAQRESRQYIIEKYGDKYCPARPPEYRAKKRAQEAHEAIRPTLPLRHPKDIEPYLAQDQYKLYNMIWKRFISSQMANALFSVLAVNIDAGDYRFRSGGAQLIFDGFLRVYREDGEMEAEAQEIPPLEPQEEVDLKEIIREQHFTKPPPRYTDASLVKMLEEKGIGRPSTYAPIIGTVIARNYIKRMGRGLQPTDLGELVNGLLVDNFPDIVDYEFTARMEDELDGVEEGKVEWVKALKDFYTSFTRQLDNAKEKMRSVKKQVVKTDQVCEMCGKPMVVKWGRRGKFLSCSDFPVCKNAKSISTGVKCPAEGCEGELVERKSRRGAFYGCTKYPGCTYTSKKLPGEAAPEADKSDPQIEEE